MADILTNRTELTQIASGDFLHIVDVSDLTDNAAGTSKKIQIANLLGFGTTFPTSPFSGQQFYKTDAFGSGEGALCIWNGASWVTMQIYEVKLPEVTVSSDTNSAIQWIGDTYNLRYVRFEVRTTVATTNDGTSYWDISARAVALDNSVTVISTVSTSADSINTFYDHGETSDSTNTANRGGIYFRAQKAGATATPGNLKYSAKMTYRLIVT